MNRQDIVALACVFLMAVACARAGFAEELQLQNAWIRAMPPTQRMTAGYLDIYNAGSVPAEITGAHTSIAQQAQIHVSLEVEGYVQMQHLERLTVNPGETVSLSPGGMHLMLMGLEKMPAPGTSADICLVLSSGSEICATATVRKGSAGVQSRHH